MFIRWSAVLTLAVAVCVASPRSLLEGQAKHQGRGDAEGRQSLPDFQVFDDMLKALRDMQDIYFQRWVGTWPQGIDWTRAVMGTYVAAALRTISDQLEQGSPQSEPFASAIKYGDPISGYFTDLIAYYFGQDAFAIRNQAHDDMLWVVLGWLEAIQFIDGHNSLIGMGPVELFQDESWYGNRWVPAFAHRARIFWELAAKGWDTTLCGGGMIWNPRLHPYKNAITNQLFISASISMFLHFPGDPNPSPFDATPDPDTPYRHTRVGWRPHDPIFKISALKAHEWIVSSNMTNSQGLYADGFHISGYPGGNNTKCDDRDEMVYTYNQGVLLSGLRGLFQATGREAYLREGHTLIQNVIRATGYDLKRNKPIDDIRNLLPGQIPPWRGLGRAGVLEDACDISGMCSQDAQTFKGIWMHHFTAFCSPALLDHVPPVSFKLSEDAMNNLRARHARNCVRYVGWLRHNAAAALGTRDMKGRFGMWWTPGLPELRGLASGNMQLTEEALPPANGQDGIIDYRNFGVPQDKVWVGHLEEEHDNPVMNDDDDYDDDETRQRPLRGRQPRTGAAASSAAATAANKNPEGCEVDGSDPNCRGRGRTVETQGGGLAVLRALWEVSKQVS
ncbi:glycoside hydrolase family 76 protein [Canariomyces notabilis]|uniref:Glycoside hydrolase family 76 protein n=1 Tax=Canariomyces notabilis TaxID=2074819 RepID=A0AAN6YWJ3_9PEZI|nr:glycoside hydrolase family 76 protein [Canariomyces arenarius]